MTYTITEELKKKTEKLKALEADLREFKDHIEEDIKRAEKFIEENTTEHGETVLETQMGIVKRKLTAIRMDWLSACVRSTCEKKEKAESHSGDDEDVEEVTEATDKKKA